MRKIIRNKALNLLAKFSFPRPGIHIINSHYITANKVHQKTDFQKFREYLQFLQSIGLFVNLKEATERIIKNDLPEDDILISFTFDDGFEECYSIIAPILEEFGTRGAFFINANYIDSDKEYQKEYNSRVATTTKKPMSWDQVIDLHKRGHLIGSHNLDHTNFGALEDNEIEYQIRRNKEILEEKLNYNCDYFAWTFGKIEHFPKKALGLTEKYHKYIFSGTNYKSYFSYNGRVINRRHLEPNWPQSHIKYFLSTKKKYDSY